LPSNVLELAQTLQVAQSLPNYGFTGLLTSQQALEAILAHDKWKTEATFAHELRLEELRISSRRSGSGGVSRTQDVLAGVSDEDKKFNDLSSYGACTEKHLGLISKTKVWEGANDRSMKLFEQWYAHIQDNNIIPVKDLKEGRIKTLLLAFLWASACGHRAAKWPEAADIHLLETLKKDLRDRFSKFSKHSIVAAYESLKVFWKEINDYEQCPFNSTLISEVLDEAYEYVNRKSVEESKIDVKNSPLFSEFEKNFPHVSLESLERYYVKTRYNFVSAGVGALRKAFTTTLPAELEHKFTSAEWPKKWHQYISSYEPKWQKQLNEILQETKAEQEKWKGE
jgi:hypothetical protein